MNDLPPDAVLVGLSLATAMVGTLGGVGGAIILVPVLILLGVDPRIAAPLGILSVAAGSLAAAPRQLGEGVVHHRLGVTLEITADLPDAASEKLVRDVTENCRTLKFESYGFEEA